ncbi:MAG TPA: TorF family putative porin [Vitreimonas sp.]|uniref:TorF family putative porin n=1 Tax=Vitreimonas sp. TaxID=3069702 RepID=UPI002D669583|nr:TorF family putative porin [Vitreimonas sp.]HYD88545.1 TorF family putative porin [Vitreimonas sp.]
MKKIIGLAMLAGAATAGVAHAESTVTANVALTSDYVFRGISLSDNGPAIQGGFDYTADMFYAGVWASNVSEGIEIDVYTGITPTTGPVEWDLGVIGYFYPGADDDGAEFDYAELTAQASFGVTEQLSVGGGVWYAPENFGDTGEATYFEVNGEWTMSDALVFNAAYGNQTIEEPNGPGTEDDYNTWNLGGTYALHGFNLDLRYHDTDIDAGSDIENYTYGPSSYDSAFVVTIGREL